MDWYIWPCLCANTMKFEENGCTCSCGIVNTKWAKSVRPVWPTSFKIPEPVCAVVMPASFCKKRICYLNVIAIWMTISSCGKLLILHIAKLVTQLKRCDWLEFNIVYNLHWNWVAPFNSSRPAASQLVALDILFEVDKNMHVKLTDQHSYW